MQGDTCETACRSQDLLPVVHYMGPMAYHYLPAIRKYEIIGALLGGSMRHCRA